MVWVAASKYLDAHVAPTSGAIAQTDLLAQVPAGALQPLEKTRWQLAKFRRRRLAPKRALPTGLVRDNMVRGVYLGVQADKPGIGARQLAARMTGG